jgi:predicted acetyltransferase
MSIEIRHPEPREFAAVFEVMSAAFLQRPDIERVTAQFGPRWEPERTWAAFDGGKACGTFRSWPTELTIPGGATIPAAAVAGVTVLPTHRRRGILTRMAASAHAGIVAGGEPLAVLLASEYPIYGRFGYAPATRDARLTVESGRTSVPGDPMGSLELAPLATGTRDAMEAVFDAARARQVGEIRRRALGWDLGLGLVEDAFEGKRWNGFVVLHRNPAGEVDGYARYTAEWKTDGEAELEIQDLHALGDGAYTDLWRFLLSVDLAGTVRAVHRPVSDPLPWLLTDARAAWIDRLRDRLWVRLFDLPRALEARAYERTASLVLEVVDDEALGGTRRWRLEASPEGAACRPTDSAADLTVPVAALGGAYLGGNRLRDVARVTGVVEHRPGSLAEADILFRTADEPWCSTAF